MYKRLECLTRTGHAQTVPVPRGGAGEGPGIEPFRPNRGPLKLSANMVIENLARVLDISPDTVASIADFEQPPQGGEAAAAAPEPGWRMWSEDEAQAAAGRVRCTFLPSNARCMPHVASFGFTACRCPERAQVQLCLGDHHQPDRYVQLAIITLGFLGLECLVCADEEAQDDEERWADKFASFVTSTYAELQGRAAEKCGVLPGEAWRAAMEAAALAGARQVCGSCRPDALACGSPMIWQCCSCNWGGAQPIIPRLGTFTVSWEPCILAVMDERSSCPRCYLNEGSLISTRQQCSGCELGCTCGVWTMLLEGVSSEAIPA